MLLGSNLLGVNSVPMSTIPSPSSYKDLIFYGECRLDNISLLEENHIKSSYLNISDLNEIQHTTDEEPMGNENAISFSLGNDYIKVMKQESIN